MCYDALLFYELSITHPTFFLGSLKLLIFFYLILSKFTGLRSELFEDGRSGHLLMSCGRNVILIGTASSPRVEERIHLQ